jgi:hypothetical protein
MPDESASHTPATGPSFKFDAKRWTKIDRNVGIASLVFFISLFLPWFGASYSIYSASVDGLWHGYMYLTLIISLALIVYLILLAGLEKLPFKLPIAHRQAILIATGIDFLLALISFLTKPGGTSWQYGAYVGLIAAAVAVAPFILPAIRARRAAKS